MGDYSGAKYDGNFSLSLEEAQRKMYQFIAESLNIQKSSRVLDMACGWGTFLNYLREIEVECIGLTLSSGQARACNKNDLNVHVQYCRYVRPEDFGTFDANSCIGGLDS